LDPQRPLAVPSKAGREWRVKLPNGTTLTSMSLDDVRQKVKAGEISKEAQAAQGDDPYRPITVHAALAVMFRGAAPEGRSQKVVYRREGNGRRGWVAAGLSVVALAAVAGSYHFRDLLFESKDEVVYENIFAKRVQLWQLRYTELSGTSEEHLARGLRFAQEDTALGYRQADDAFQKALVLDPENLDAMGAYVENLAYLPVRKSDTEALKDALEGIEYAIKKNPRRAQLHRAQGALLITMDRPEQAQAALARALRLDPKNAEALLWMASTNLERNLAEAIKATEEAQQLNPELLRAPYLLGLAYQKQGKFKTALNQFRLRLQKDQDHKETLLATARLLVEVGDFSAAQQHLERLLQVDPRQVTARLMLARILYQGLGDFETAQGQLEDAVRYALESGELVKEVHTHLAFVLGERGQWKEAEDAVLMALRDDPAYGPGLYVAGRVLMHRHAATEARERLERALQAVAGTYLEATVRTTLGDAWAQQGNTAEAVRAYTTVIRNDARYVRAYLAVAAVYADGQNMQQAAAMMREVLDINPFHRRDRFYLTDYPEAASDIEAYRTAWSKLKTADADRSLVLSSEGITAFHADQMEAAMALFKKALRDDANNLGAAMYLGASSIIRGRAKDALKHLEQALRANSLHVRTLYLLGRAYQLLQRMDDAERKFQEVRDTDPNFVAAINALGEVTAHRGDASKARELFLDAFRADADYTPAKASLLKSGY
jgi:tetratricopeptide (TPR) repeat protein